VIEKLVPLVRWLLAGPSGLQMKGGSILNLLRIYEYSLSPTVSSDFINQTALREERGYVMRLLR
jgi:hypothetical protein